MRTSPLLALLLFLAPTGLGAADPEPVEVDVFWAEGCPYCDLQIQALTGLAGERPWMRLQLSELSRDADARQRFQAMALAAGIRPDSVPTTFIGGRAWVGFSEAQLAEIAEWLDRCQHGACPDPQTGPDGASTVRLPGWGEFELQERNLLVGTALIALVDGFNPCSLWVLCMLLSLVLISGSRLRIAAVGLTFLLVTTLVYGLFMLGLVRMLALLSHLDAIRMLVALVALVFAIVHIKDYFWLGRGLSLSIPDSAKPGIYRRLRGLMERSGFALVGATVVLALGIALVELPCTAGFPLLWSQLVAARQPSNAEFAMLLALYLLIYLADELVVFGLAIVTLRLGRMQEVHGRRLKLAGGALMFVLALTLLLAPRALESLTGTLAMLLSALVVAGGLAFLGRRLGMADRT
jgi:cytochrome c biogenesis protein CcdA